MKCKKCGAEYGEDVKFCTQCGAPMGDEGQDSQAGTEPAMDAQADGEAEAGTISAEAQAPEEGQPEAVTEPAEAAGQSHHRQSLLSRQKSQRQTVPCRFRYRRQANRSQTRSS